MTYNITPNPEERNNLITTSKFFELFGTWLPSLVPVFVEFLRASIPVSPWRAFIPDLPIS